MKLLGVKSIVIESKNGTKVVHNNVTIAAMTPQELGALSTAINVRVAWLRSLQNIQSTPLTVADNTQKGVQLSKMVTTCTHITVAAKKHKVEKFLAATGFYKTVKAYLSKMVKTHDEKKAQEKSELEKRV